ncbi:hypothetical protein LIER_37263 [Lithospermum erythrorhizon]|uniref:Uncharacterized protein n=1 Tax=Lithospermum erythrorhizon TaxID=34254 RepID=A0AAV3PJ37_LITER
MYNCIGEDEQWQEVFGDEVIDFLKEILALKLFPTQVIMNGLQMVVGSSFWADGNTREEATAVDGDRRENWGGRNLVS